MAAFAVDEAATPGVLVPDVVAKSEEPFSDLDAASSPPQAATGASAPAKQAEHAAATLG